MMFQISLRTRSEEGTVRWLSLQASGPHLSIQITSVKSHLRSGSQILREQEMHNLRLEVDHLRRWLRHRVHLRENRTPSLSQSSSLE